MRFFFTAIIVFTAAGCLNASDPELKDFRELPSAGHSENLIKNPSFLEGNAHWIIRPGNGYETGPFGPNNVPALRQKFVTGEKYNGLVAYQKIVLKPKTTYRYGSLQKMEKLHRIKNGQVQPRRPNICIDWSYKGQWVNSYFAGDKTGGKVDIEGKWAKVEYEFTTPSNPDYTYLLYANAPATGGEACWTNFYLEEAVARCIFFLVYPRFGALTPENRMIEIGTYLEGEFKYRKDKEPRLFCRLEVSAQNGEKVRTLLSPLERERVRFDLQGLPEGKYRLSLLLLDMPNRYILSRETLPLQIAGPEKTGKNEVRLDARGRMLIGGKPFMPVAIYTWAIKEDQTREIKSLGFNSFVPYGTLTSNPLKRASLGVQSMRDALDICSKYEIYVMPAVSPLDMPPVWENISKKEYYSLLGKLISEFRTHPAIIAWYISDEPVPSAIRELEKLRNFVNESDGKHPTWAVFNTPAELPKYAAATDIAAMDPYPFTYGKKELEQYTVLDQTSTLQKLLGNLDGEGALWLVPQAFSWKIYRDTRSKKLQKENPEVYDDMPTGRQILAMSLMGAIHGAKGFCFYEYQFWNAPELFKKFGPHLKYAAGTLSANSDLILGTGKAPAVTLKEIKGTVRAKAFRSDDGKAGIFISAVGPGESVAEITLHDTCGGLSSVLGNSKETSPGVWLFKGTGIDCDIIRN